eukprot:gnl/TRDRNA2_/TRDRNA2_137957_c0_seq1.p1 gnl/TRDRNA2_/TRDRNA2_137957_c0~~gnl/TRDRNA2_/TRDRNA2_137957_c0_seq1.p1  ORF type:complete len:366 (+),score=93.01 gnl/TRDRNA2_/TRDRNA2_137957_c0_seq1:117-1100(+)
MKEVVMTATGNCLIHSRLWCVFEADCAYKLGLPVTLAGDAMNLLMSKEQQKITKASGGMDLDDEQVRNTAVVALEVSLCMMKALAQHPENSDCPEDLCAIIKGCCDPVKMDPSIPTTCKNMKAFLLSALDGPPKEEEGAYSVGMVSLAHAACFSEDDKRNIMGEIGDNMFEVQKFIYDKIVSYLKPELGPSYAVMRAEMFDQIGLKDVEAEDKAAAVGACGVSTSGGTSAGTAWARNLVNNPGVVATVAAQRFRKYDIDSSGFLEWGEVPALIQELCQCLGTSEPDDEMLRGVFESNDTNADGKLDEQEFVGFFRQFLSFQLQQLDG